MRTTLKSKIEQRQALDKRRRVLTEPLTSIVTEARYPAAPTPERVAKAAHGLAQTASGPVRVMDVLEGYAHELTAVELNAALVMRELALTANAAMAPSTSSYGSRATEYGPTGGRVQERDRAAFQRYREVWGELPEQFRSTLVDLVYGSDKTLADHGAKWITLRDVSTRKGAGLAALRAALIQSAKILHDIERRRRHNRGPAIAD